MPPQRGAWPLWPTLHQRSSRGCAAFSAAHPLPLVGASESSTVCAPLGAVHRGFKYAATGMRKGHLNVTGSSHSQTYTNQTVSPTLCAANRPGLTPSNGPPDPFVIQWPSPPIATHQKSTWPRFTPQKMALRSRHFETFPRWGLSPSRTTRRHNSG